jgi:hypothetical protein
VTSREHGIAAEGAEGLPARRTTPGGEPGATQADRCLLAGGGVRAWQVVGGALYVTMTALGTATLFLACGDAIWSWIAAAAYCVYTPAAGLLFAIRGCAHCAGRPARPPDGDGDTAQARGFWLHLPLVLPAWLLPPVAAGVAVWRGFSWSAVTLGALFALESMLLLPLVARFYICPHCPQKDTCPWMRGRARPSNDANGG